MKAQLMHTKGTWISEVGLSIGSELTIEMSVNKADEQKTECPVDSDSKDANKLRPQCWKGGKVQVNGRTLVHVGKAEVVDFEKSSNRSIQRFIPLFNSFVYFQKKFCACRTLSLPKFL